MSRLEDDCGLVGPGLFVRTRVPMIFGERPASATCDDSLIPRKRWQGVCGGDKMCVRCASVLLLLVSLNA